VRDAVVYVRQSTAFQVAQNLESQRRQDGLAERARSNSRRQVLGALPANSEPSGENE
jgi:hypothetical protein